VVTVSVRRIKLAFASACPLKDVFAHALQRLRELQAHCKTLSRPNRNPDEDQPQGNSAEPANRPQRQAFGRSDATPFPRLPDAGQSQ